jgi:tetratricopeptide (TPR) repeat protein
MRGELTRGTFNALLVVVAVMFGAAAWLLIGPRWVMAGLLAGPALLVVGVVAIRRSKLPDPTALLRNQQPTEAIAPLSSAMPGLRTLARIWPGQFRDALASRLMVRSGALQAAHLDAEALQTANEAVAIYQDLAAERPGTYAPDLADALDHQSRLLATDDRLAEALAAIGVAVRLYRNLAAADPSAYLPALAESLTCQAGWLTEIELPTEALAAVQEAHQICQDRLPWPQVPPGAARAAMLEGELLCRQDRHREAARPLAQGWAMAAAREWHELLRDAMPAIRAAYRADPRHFAAEWRAETGAEPPDWLTG